MFKVDSQVVVELAGLMKLDRAGKGQSKLETLLDGQQSRVYARGVGVKTSPWAWYFAKTLLPAQRDYTSLANFLLVDLLT